MKEIGHDFLLRTSRDLRDTRRAFRNVARA
jgi:hypothetical protein